MGYYNNNYRYSYGIEITKREIIVSVAIVLIMISLGLFFSVKIDDAVQTNNEVFQKALKIDNNQDQFLYGMKTNVGNSVVYGEFVANDTVTEPSILGEYTKIKKETERYTRHIRTVTTTDSKGRSHSRTETYYTWDTIDIENWGASEFTFLGKTFSTSFFGFGSCDVLDLSQFISPELADKVSGRYLYKDGHSWFDSEGDIRYSYYTIPKSFYGSFMAKLEFDNVWALNVKDSIKVSRDTSLKDFLDRNISSSIGWLLMFWFLWFILIGGAVYGFYYLDNNWLED